MIFEGKAQTCEVLVDGRRLSPERSRKRWDHSDDFSWGYGGSGPAQLALALLLEAGYDDEHAEEMYMAFKWEVVAKLPQHEDFVLEKSAIDAWVERFDSNRVEESEEESTLVPF